MVRHVFGEADETALMAALLHDLIEDTTSGSDSQRTKFVEKAERAIRCAGDVPELQSAAKKLRSLVSG